MVTLQTLAALPIRVVNVQLITEVFLLAKKKTPNELYNLNLDGSDHKDTDHGTNSDRLSPTSFKFLYFNTTTDIN